MQRKGRGYWSGIVGRIPIRFQDLVWRAWLEIFQVFLFQEEEEAVSCKKNFPESHILNPLLTKFVRSRWLDIGLVLFCEFMDRDESVTQKKNLANIQPS